MDCRGWVCELGGEIGYELDGAEFEHRYGEGLLFSTHVQSGSGFCPIPCNMDTRTLSRDFSGQGAKLSVHFSASGSGCLIPRKNVESFDCSSPLF